MPALRILGGRIAWLADDDLRGLSKYSLLLRIGQLLGLSLPSFILLLLNDDEDCINDDDDHASLVVWSFWSLSFATLLCSLVLESFIFRIAGQGSPTQQKEARPSLPRLCTVKVLPLSAVQIVTVLLAAYTARILQQQQQEQEIAFPCEETPCSSQPQLCHATTKILLVLAYTLMVELAVIALIVLGLLLFHVRHPACRRDRRTSFRERMQRNQRQASWHGCFRCCCACTSCCTCCVFGGSEVWRSSSRHATPGGGGGSSSLADISVLLADFFDTTGSGRLDITPSDLLLGFTVLRMEQRRQREMRLKQLREELEHSVFIAQEDEASPHREHHGVEASLTSVVLTQMEEEEGNASAAVVTIHSFAIGSFTESELQAEYDDDPSSSSKAESDGETDARPTRDLANSASSLGVVQNLQMCRTSGDDAQVYFKVTTRRRLRPNHNDRDRQILQEGAYYVRYALAAYGHLMYLAQHTCTAPCCLTVGCLSCRTWSTTPRVVQGDNLCRCNELGFLLRADLPHSAIAYASFQTGIQSCPYIICVDPEQRTVVLAIQGTFSLESLVTDLNVRPELLELYGDDCPVFAEASMKNEYCHSGMLHCTLNMYKDLERHQVLDQLLLGPSPKLPGYSLVITGHSLGAGCAAILAVMLRRKFPQLRGLCFAPPGCVLSLGAAQDSHITSYVLDADLVPRLSLHSVVGLRNDVIEMIARVKVPKHTILGRGYAKKEDSENNNCMSLMHRQDSIPPSPYYDRVLEFQKHQTQLANARNVPDVKLCLPGRQIVQLIENRLDYSWRRGSAYIPIFAEREDFQEIQLNKNFLVDHDPERYLRILTNAMNK